jgi:hypothetical protein
MTDVTYNKRYGSTTYPTKLIDNGDGTYSDALTVTTGAVEGMADAGPSEDLGLVQTYTVSADMSTAATITNMPVSGKKLALYDLIISAGAAMSYQILMETSNNVLAMFYMPANTTLQITPRGLLKADVVDKRIFGKASVAGAVSVTAIYCSVDAVVSASVSPSSSVSPSASLSPSSSVSPSISPSASVSPSSSVSPSVSPSSSNSPSVSPSLSVSPSASLSPSASDSPSGG